MSQKLIGVFDSGVGGLTVLRKIHKKLPKYSTMYLGDNKNAPYGEKSEEEIYKLTKQAVEFLFENGCELVILACNTATAYALRRIQKELISKQSTKRVLGIIRPTEEFLAGKGYKNIGILATSATVMSGAYDRESKHLPQISVFMQACPTWVSYIESGDFVSKKWRNEMQKDIDSLYLNQENLDSILLGCTHYPAVIDIIREALPKSVPIITQGIIVAESLIDYLERNIHLDKKLDKKSQRIYMTTGTVKEIDQIVTYLMGNSVKFKEVALSIKNL